MTNMNLNELYEAMILSLGEASQKEEPATIAELYGIKDGSAIAKAATIADIISCFASLKEDEAAMDKAVDLLDSVLEEREEEDASWWISWWLVEAETLARDLGLIA